MSTWLINRRKPSEIFLRARNMAGQHLERMFAKFNADKDNRFEMFRWIKPELTSPSFEHFTFGYRNAVFSILVDLLKDGKSTIPPDERKLLCDESHRYNLIPCVFEVTVATVMSDADGLYRGVAGKSAYGLRIPTEGWNLRHAQTGSEVNPPDVGKDDDTPMSVWELQNFAIGIVRQYGVEKIGFKFDSFCDIPEIDPQIWFRDNSGNRSWALVRFQRQIDESKADSFRDFVKDNPHLAPYDGYFVPVSAAMADPVLKDKNGILIPLSKRFDGSLPLYRGHEMFVNFLRMIKIHSAR